MREVAVFQGGFVLQLLDEMAVPAQPRLERGQGTRPARVARRADRPEFRHQFLPRSRGLVSLPHGNTAESEVGAEPAARRPGGFRGGHCAAVIHAAPLQERLQQPLSVRLAARLRERLRARGQAEVGGSLDAPGLHGRHDAEFPRRGGEGFAHARRPALRPAVPAGVGAENTVLGHFRPRDAPGAAPRADPPVPGVGQSVAGLLVAPEPRDAVFGVQPVEHVGQAADAAGEAATEGAQAPVEFGERLVDEHQMRGIEVLRADDLRLVNVQRQQRRAATRRLVQGPVILQAQIAFEPDDLQPGFHVAPSCKGGVFSTASTGKGKEG